ncbi:MAG: S49 family peptidase [Candidatus Dependentiae bacterium]|nr:S49 family peptidase [Candidatus Dependentiae bacterium]
MFKINHYLKTILFTFLIIQIAPSIISNIKYYWNNNFEHRNKIGYITIIGSIENSSHYRSYLSEYFKDSSIKAILLKIESNGGAAGSCQALAFDIEQLKKEYPKPIITYTENICISGAYEIAAATDYIVATGSAIIGCIDAHISTNLQNSLKSCNEIASSSCKGSTNQSISTIDTQNGMLQSLVDNTYQQLSKEIAFKRHLQLNKIDQWGCGKLFTGQQAYDLKLVDAIGSIMTAINLITKNIIPSDRKIEWIKPPKKNSISKFFNNEENEDLNSSIKAPLLESLIQDIV